MQILCYRVEKQMRFMIKNNENNPYIVSFESSTLKIIVKGTEEEQNIVGIVSYPNVDYGNQKIVSVIEKYKDNPNFIFYKNLTRNLFLSIYKRSKFIIGNSSSGICEAASVPIPAINVGIRQLGRYADSNVVFCDSSYSSIKQALQEVCEESFTSKLHNLCNSYGKGNGAERAFQIIKNTDFKPLVAKYIL